MKKVKISSTDHGTIDKAHSLLQWIFDYWIKPWTLNFARGQSSNECFMDLDPEFNRLKSHGTIQDFSIVPVIASNGDPLVLGYIRIGDAFYNIHISKSVCLLGYFAYTPA
jgi:hypothetical protein